MKIWTEHIPDDCNYLTPFKMYEVEELMDGDMAIITDDKKGILFTRLTNTAHLNGGSWHINNKPEKS